MGRLTLPFGFCLRGGLSLALGFCLWGVSRAMCGLRMGGANLFGYGGLNAALWVGWDNAQTNPIMLMVLALGGLPESGRAGPCREA